MLAASTMHLLGAAVFSLIAMLAAVYAGITKLFGSEVMEGYPGGYSMRRENALVTVSTCLALGLAIGAFALSQ